MGSYRQFNRVKCELPITLMDCNGKNYNALLEDVSIGGALIIVKDGIPDRLHEGEECSLLLYNNASLKHSCKVIWHDSGNIGLSYSPLEYNSLLPRLLPQLSPYLF